MWLLDTSSLELHEFNDSNIPSYAILSHTWDATEITFSELQQNSLEALQIKPGFTKMTKFCECAKERGNSYVWMDTCCIDKRNSADLSEAINSMFRYYRKAKECIIFLSDVPAASKDSASTPREQKEDAIRNSRWFTRGWTLQELIAPKKRTFFSSAWEEINDIENLSELISNITKIDIRLLQNRKLLYTFCTAERMSWAANRRTTRREDKAYSLLGLFNIHMPVIYGEGAANAFKRLQEEILRTSFDQTIFAWRGNYKSSGLLARSPTDFANPPVLSLWGTRLLTPFAMTNVGLSITVNIAKMPESEKTSLPDDVRNHHIYAATLACDIRNEKAWFFLVLYLARVPETQFFVNGKTCDAYLRVKCDAWVEAPMEWFPGEKGPGVLRDILVLEDHHIDLLERAHNDDKARKKHLPSGSRVGPSTMDE